jgi:transposase
MPEHQLNHFFVGKGIDLIQTRSFRGGWLWDCVKKRQGAEICPKCATPSTTRFGRATVTVRDEAIRRMPITLKIVKHRYFCKTCRKPFTEPVQGILPRRRTTQRLRNQILKDCDEVVNLSRVARRHFCSKSLVHKIFYSQMEIKLRERKQIRWPLAVGIDEHFFRRNRAFSEFTTVFTNVHKKRMFEMALSKNKASIIEQVSHIPGREDVRFAVLDLSRGYRSTVQTLFPNAELVADKFHVLRLITPALIKARREIHGHRQDLSLRRKLLKNRQKLDYFERCDLDRYLKKHPKLNELYRFKERLSEFYRTKGSNRASLALANIINAAKLSEYYEINRLGQTLHEWRTEILNYFKYGYTNAFTEAMNAIAKLVQRRGCGYRNFKNYRLRTLSACPL